MTKTDVPDLDEASRAAVAALAHRIRNRDATDDPGDAEVFALEYLTALRGQGWRPTAARPAPSWQPNQGPPPEPDVAQRGADMARQMLTRGDSE